MISIRSSKINRRDSIIIHAFFVILTLIFIIPILTVISISISDEKRVLEQGYSILPQNFNLDAYRYVFANMGQMVSSYKVTITVSVIGTLLSMLLMMMCAYALSRKTFALRNFIALYIFFTMLFSGGLISGYILTTQYLHLKDTLLVLILSGLVSPWNMFILRSFIRQIPESIIESAYIDGASEMRIFTRIILPLSKPAIATIGLFVLLHYWNDWYTALLYINKAELYPIQYLLQRILQDLEEITRNMDNMPQLSGLIQTVPSETVRMALAVIAAGPMLIILPFFQRYFVRGLTIGSVKE